LLFLTQVRLYKRFNVINIKKVMQIFLQYKDKNFKFFKKLSKKIININFFKRLIFFSKQFLKNLKFLSLY